MLAAERRDLRLRACQLRLDVDERVLGGAQRALLLLDLLVRVRVTSFKMLTLLDDEVDGGLQVLAVLGVGALGLLVELTALL